jgi:hypothetical protein
MFYEQVKAVLDSDRSTGWGLVAKALGYSQHELRNRIEQQSLSFEECILLTKVSYSPELLRYVIDQFSHKTLHH